MSFRQINFHVNSPLLLHLTLLLLLYRICHIIGWLSLALLAPGRDYLLYIHCVFSSLSGIVIVITSYASSNYFSKSRAFVASLLAGAGISSTMWFSVYQVDFFISNEEKEIFCLFEVCIDSGRIRLHTLAYIWLAFGLIMLMTSFAFLDWKYSFCKLPYQFNLQLESNGSETDRSNGGNFWKHFTSPLYLLVVLFLSLVLIPTVFLSVCWEPFITHLTKGDKALGILLK